MHHNSQYRAGRSNTQQYPSSPSSIHAGLVSYSPIKSSLSRSYMRDEHRAGAYSAPRHQQSSTRSMTLPNIISSSIATTTMPVPPPSAKTMPNLTNMHAKLHKRGSASASDLPGIQHISTKEPFPEITSTAPVQSSPVAKVKPYLRKLSSTKDDQGRIDLSKSLADNEKLAGLGIQDHEYASRSSTDAVFAPRHTAHARTTSVGSQMSANSTNSYRPQPFVHPMRQAPRPYTPPTTHSHTFHPPDDDDDEENDHQPSFTFRPRRSMSHSSNHVAPTPLSQTLTAADLGYIPRLTNASQSNLSIASTKSSKPNRSRGNTNRSQEAASPSSRTSFDRPFPLVARRSDTDAQTREERIAEMRRKFQEKEAGKDKKAEKEAMKRREAEEIKEQRRQERQRRKSDASERSRMQRPGTGQRTGSSLGIHSTLAEDIQSSPGASSSTEKPRLTQTVGVVEKAGFFSRLFNCGGRRK